uniref:TACC_C domain-containing protein n=1 Tax=Rhabditophanes sp. KR3021 TaxID=114890 RepID=A0AC35TNJ0_9BILA
MSNKRIFDNDSDLSLGSNENAFESPRTKACPRKRFTPGSALRSPLASRILEKQESDVSIAPSDQLLTEAEISSARLDRGISCDLVQDISSSIEDKSVAEEKDVDLSITSSNQLLTGTSFTPTRHGKDISCNLDRTSPTIGNKSVAEEKEADLSIAPSNQLVTVAETSSATRLFGDISYNSEHDTSSRINDKSILEEKDADFSVAPLEQLVMETETTTIDTSSLIESNSIAEEKDTDFAIASLEQQLLMEIEATPIDTSSLIESNSIVEEKDSEFTITPLEQLPMEAEASSITRHAGDMSCNLDRDTSSTIEDKSIVEEKDDDLSIVPSDKVTTETSFTTKLAGDISYDLKLDNSSRIEDKSIVEEKDCDLSCASSNQLFMETETSDSHVKDISCNLGQDATLSIASPNQLLMDAESSSTTSLVRNASYNLECDTSSRIENKSIVEKNDADFSIAPLEQLFTDTETTATTRHDDRDSFCDLKQNSFSLIKESSIVEEKDADLTTASSNHLFMDTETSPRDSSSSIPNKSIFEEHGADLSIASSEKFLIEAETSLNTGLGHDSFYSLGENDSSTIQNNSIVKDADLSIDTSDKLLVEAETSSNTSLVQHTSNNLGQNDSSSIQNNSIVKDADLSIVPSDEFPIEAETSSNTSLVQHMSNNLGQNNSSSIQNNSIVKDADLSIVPSDEFPMEAETSSITGLVQNSFCDLGQNDSSSVHYNSIVEEKGVLSEVTAKDENDCLQAQDEEMKLEPVTAKLGNLSITIYEEKSILENRLSESESLCATLQGENQRIISETFDVKSSFSEMEKSLQMKDEILLKLEETISRLSNNEAILLQDLKEEKERNINLSQENEKVIAETSNIKLAFLEMEKALQVKNKELLEFEERITEMSSQQVALLHEFEEEKGHNHCLSEENHKMIAEVCGVKSSLTDMEKAFKMKDDELLEIEKKITAMSGVEAALVRDLKEEKGKNFCLFEENQKMIAEVAFIKVSFAEMEKALKIKMNELIEYEETITRMSNKEQEMENELIKAHDKQNETEKELMKLRLSHDNVNMDNKSRDEKNDIFMEKVQTNFNTVSTSVKMIEDKMKCELIDQLLEDFKIMNQRVSEISNKLDSTAEIEALNKENTRLKKKLSKSEEEYETVEKDFLSAQKTATDFNEQIITLQVKYGEITPEDAARLFVDPSKNDKYFEQFVKK